MLSRPIAAGVDATWLQRGARCAHAGLAAALLAGGAFIAAHHPLSPALALVTLAAWFAVACRRPELWLFVVPLALPAANLSPWSGWIALDEFDLLLLASLAAGYLRRPARPAQSGVADRAGTGLAVVLGVLTLVALTRGLHDSGGAPQWFDGYVDPGNSLRAAKSLAWSLLALPLLRDELRRDAGRALRLLAGGMLAGLVLTTFAVLLERAAYPGLLDFAAVYRTTAWFWEMHVGGAAIDAWLVLATPFVVWALWSARSPAAWAGWALLAWLLGFACLTTFSRGVYIAVAAQLALLAWLLLRLRTAPPRWQAVASAVLLLALATLLLGAAFRALAYAGIGLSLIAVLALAVLLGRRVAARVSWRAAGSGALVLLLSAQAVVVLGPESFMWRRFAGSGIDSIGRIEHWQRGIGLLAAPADWLWGIGLGRLPAHYGATVREFPGAVHLLSADGGSVVIDGPRSSSQLGGLFGLTQRVASRASYRLDFDVRAPLDSNVRVRICERHLLYDGRCGAVQVRVVAAPARWQHVRLALPGFSGSAERWPRRSPVFSIAVVNAGGSAEFDNFRLVAPDGQPLLDNGDFARGLAGWLPSAQRYFLPWHIDNLFLEALIERGLLFLLAFVSLIALALRRLLADRRPQRMFVAASLGGVLVLGLASSVLDVPRVAFAFWLLLWLAVELPRGAATYDAAPPSQARVDSP